ncbi:glucan biosynthesis protein [Prosthecodimorpha staleyi]|uniref:Glucan biosynthesis protein n=1 Tax=Prosthecodimorpha staleyi TaxID=2840188 RepID=A0A947CZ01_9HYPH|nr:glucan biosynthesis protein [Prosthecodimorpha staleyi]MBT9287893.1 glucan biosynthesis protein [Prosthecodimorpha staleyi]
MHPSDLASPDRPVEALSLPDPARRRFLSQSLAVGSAIGFAGMLAGLIGEAKAAPGDPMPFSRAMLLDEARKRAGEAYQEPKFDLPERFANLTYEQYRDIRFKLNRFLWRGENRGFQVSLLHTGFIYKQPVDIFVVDEGQAREILFDREMFDYGQSVKPPDDKVDLSFSGLKVRRPLNSDRWEEFAMFQGATFFRALARGQIYGVSARGLAINTGDERGEEFAFFERFWIERPEPNANSVVIHAFLDSKSCTGVYRFTLRPGDETVLDVELTLFPRVDLDHVGIGALTSMFLYDGTSRTRFDDLRPAVHGSDGLAIVTGLGEHLFRPLANPRNLQISAFVDQSPRAFGLVQRRQEFGEFEDLEARYDLKPSCWVESIGDWGAGAVQLLEVPSESEIHENIICYWRPKQKLPAKQEFSAAYRLHYGRNSPPAGELGSVAATRSGQGSNPAFRRFLIDFEGKMPPAGAVKAEATSSAGRIVNLVLKPNPVRGGYRVLFELDPRNAPLVELRVLLNDGSKPVSETWLYRWTA